ncbi:D-amino acid dehydrogenase [Emcibacter nanhaiensis]|uniref:FAD-dependent oxidoreductase n=2 Tax=Emcibacter nanhaiensis TaxID=1505037 RepID=A0A501PIE9_9PROT|nr:D-amino acid dehydrogenase [Emcibacter nanhaiensis]TPD59606.1 FAD-dependent oxidoreductase [Emcibacter nanhaiensis]
MKAVVIGAGLQGVSTAYYLSKAGLEVTVLEQQATAGMETSFANGGILTPSMSDPWNAPGSWREMLLTMGQEDSPLLIRPRALPGMIGWGIGFLRNSSPAIFHRNTLNNFMLSHYSVQMMKEIRRESDISYDFMPSGTLKLFSDEVIFAKKLVQLAPLAAQGLKFKPMTPAQIAKLEPMLAQGIDRIAGGVYFPDDESGDAHKFCQALMAETKQRGVRYHFNSAVTSLEQQNGRISAVCCGSAIHQADLFVLAAGCYSSGLLGKIRARVPIQPVKGYSLTFAGDGVKDMPRIPVVDDELHAALVPLGKRFRIAGTAEFAGFDRTLSKGRVDNLRDVIARVYPSLLDNLQDKTGEAWTGFRPVSPDGVPLIGRLGAENLFINAGHGHLGWTMAAGSARLLADIMTGQEPEIDSQAYRPGRF